MPYETLRSQCYIMAKVNLMVKVKVRPRSWSMSVMNGHLITVVWRSM